LRRAWRIKAWSTDGEKLVCVGGVNNDAGGVVSLMDGEEAGREERRQKEGRGEELM